MIIELKTIPKYFLTYKNPTRKQSVIDEFNKWSMETPKEFNPEDNIPRYSSGASGFIKMLKHGYGNEPFMMLEDDIRIEREFCDIEVPEDADILYVGLSRWGLDPIQWVGIYNGVKYTEVNDTIVRLNNMCSTHGFVSCSKKGTEMLQYCMHNSYKYNIPWDIPLSKNHKEMNVYAVRDCMVYQCDEHGGKGSEDYTRIKFRN